MIRNVVLSAALLASVSACTWVKMEADGAQVRVARVGDDLSSCVRRGEVGVSVRDKVGLYQRNDLKVRDELETLARNEASSLSADTVQALNDPSAGEQQFAAFSCGRNAPIGRAPVRDAAPVVTEGPRQADEAQTFPIDGD